MMKLARILLFVPALFFIACGEPAAEEEPVSPTAIMGTWKRVKYKPETNPDTAWLDTKPGELYYKHITPTHFNWISYKPETDQMEGAGGGLYTFDGKQYIEDIEFFLPIGSSARGQSIPFDARFEGGDWYHTGYIRNFELDTELGEYALTDSSAITEIWQKVPDDGSNTSGDINLVGSWILLKSMSFPDSIWTEYPGFVGIIKHVTGTHWGRVSYDTENDGITDLGGGVYNLEEDTYTEMVEYQFPMGTGQTGAEFKFDIEVDGDLWYHSGWIYRLGEDGQPTDSSYINEVWKKYK